MRTEIILLLEDDPAVRDAVARPYIEAGVWVEAPADLAGAIAVLAAFRPDWIFVNEKHAPELLLWMRSQEDRVGVPVLLLPDVEVPSRSTHGTGHPKAA
jgi:DNA-binding response OmpR family regulator